MTTSTPRGQVEAHAVRLVRRLGNDLAELSMVIELADQHALTLPASLYRVAAALDIPAVPAEAERQLAASGHDRLGAVRGRVVAGDRVVTALAPAPAGPGGAAA